MMKTLVMWGIALAVVLLLLQAAPDSGGWFAPSQQQVERAQYLAEHGASPAVRDLAGSALKLWGLADHIEGR